MQHAEPPALIYVHMEHAHSVIGAPAAVAAGAGGAAFENSEEKVDADAAAWAGSRSNPQLALVRTGA